jgi:hypothetical protein
MLVVFSVVPFAMSLSTWIVAKQRWHDVDRGNGGYCEPLKILLFAEAVET